MKKAYVALIGVLLTGCGSEEDIMGYQPDLKAEAPIELDFSKASNDVSIQEMLKEKTAALKSQYESLHKDETTSYLNKVKRLELEFEYLAKQFEEECMTAERMKFTPECVELKDKALGVDESIRSERRNHVGKLNTLKSQYVVEVNSSIDELN
ncbi:hypothetical protein [Vibrio sp. D431a]|uniref:hypothetical protein n=1 Tax=Vibrio sp. D431a TaxID=2837388 RepID=UPI0025541CFB|nr:hypothetical protein [Vibrio sp. D431a]MDK9793291.1 hypothetical protein [Vibrio sp. D431a]